MIFQFEDNKFITKNKKKDKKSQGIGKRILPMKIEDFLDHEMILDENK